MARDRPSPYAEGGPFFDQKPARYRSAGPLGCHPRIREGFPREFLVARSMARDRPSPYAEGGPFFDSELFIYNGEIDTLSDKPLLLQLQGSSIIGFTTGQLNAFFTKLLTFLN